MNHENSITVHGSASASAVPDTMSLSLAVENHHAQAAQAFEQVSAGAHALITAVLSVAPETNLSTSGVTLSARTAWRDEMNVLLGYDASTTLEATAVPLEAISAVLAAAVETGGDDLRIHSLRSEVSDPISALRAARELAFSDAHSKAAELAQLAGRQLGQALQIRESGPDSAVPLQRAGLRAMAAKSMPVIAGSQELVVNLEIKWELLDHGQAPAED